MPKIKTYVLTVSRVFPKTHKRAGQNTGFVQQITKLFSSENTKIHTIRANYDLWNKRAKEINEGRAILSIRYWSDKPYNSKQVEICRLEKGGIQKICFLNGNIYDPIIDDNIEKSLAEVSFNDGLSAIDFIEWFKGYDLSEPMAIIHFTDFRY